MGTSSGMIYIHELESVLSSIFLTAGSFSLSLPIHDQYHACEPTKSMARNSQLARAFTLIEVIVVLAIIVIMMAMVYPAYTTISERAKATKDMSNLRQIGLAIQTYLNDSDQILPPSTTWPGTTVTPVLYPKYVGTRKVFLSPFDKRPSLETDLASQLQHQPSKPSLLKKELDLTRKLGDRASELKCGVPAHPTEGHSRCQKR